MPDPPPFITPIETVPNAGSEADTYQAVLQSLPDMTLDTMSSMDTADFINRIRDEYQLQEKQRVAFAQFLRDIMMGIPTRPDLAGDLALRISVDEKTALQILHAVERDILLAAGMSLKDIGKTAAGPRVREEAGRLLLRYDSLDDLLGAIEDMALDDRRRFLEDAKQDNRILVIKALTHLKLGTDSKGRPLTFLQLARQEAPDFTGRDWVDILEEDKAVIQDPEVRQALVTFLTSTERIVALFIDVTDVDSAEIFHNALNEALPRTKPAVSEYVKWSPYFAGVFEKGGGINRDLFERFATLADGTRAQIVAPALSERIIELIREGTIPKNYGVAVAKIVFFVAVGHIQPEALATLLGEKLGLGAKQGAQIADRITEDLLSQISFIEAVPEEPEAPEKTEAAIGTETEEVARSAKEPRNAKIDNMKNVVDLRQRNPGG